MAGLYVHIPFCESKCSYCDFASFANRSADIESYFQALQRDIYLQAEKYKNTVLQTIYFGGGTPSFVNAKYITSIVEILRKQFQFATELEMTIEMNPNSVSAEKLDRYKKAGFNRFSVGLQTAVDRQLREIGRVHTLQDFKRTAELLQGQNWSADIMLGLKGQTLSDILYSIDCALSAGVSHLSVYALTAEENTPIYREYQAGLLPNEEVVAEFYNKVLNYLEGKNFQRYEVSNFAKNGKESKHNLIYWHAESYLGLGLSASSYMEGVRFTNTANLQEYISKLEKGELPIADCEEIDEKTAKFEYIMLSLRLTKGIQLQEYKKRFQTDFLKEYAQAIAKNLPYLEITRQAVAIKKEYLYVQNSILLDFIN